VARRGFTGTKLADFANANLASIWLIFISLAVSRIEASMVSKRIDVRDLEDGMLTLVGKGR